MTTLDVVTRHDVEDLLTTLIQLQHSFQPDALGTAVCEPTLVTSKTRMIHQTTYTSLRCSLTLTDPSSLIH